MTETIEAPEEATQTPVPLHMRPNLHWFAAEFVVVVSGVLVALMLNAWWQDRQDHASESHYLSLLSRDLQSAIVDLEAAQSFEDSAVRDGLFAYRALSGDSVPEDTLPASLAMARLGSRRTLALHDATYEDLLHTGNLRLLGNAELRDRIVSHYSTARRWVEIVNKNNGFFVDEMYNTHVIYSGLIMPRTFRNVDSEIQHALDQLSQPLAAGYSNDVDRLWTLPRDGEEWSVVRNNLMSRYLVAGSIRTFEARIAAEARELKAAVDAELARR